MHIKHMLSGVAASVALAAVLGCGGDDPGEAAARATPSPAPAMAAEQKSVAIAGYEFQPKRLTVAVGTRVTWVDKDAANHTVTFDSGPGDLGNVDPNERLSAEFTSPGTFAYVCQYHPNMTGTVVVK